MNNLILDIGNSRIKGALFSDNEIVEAYTRDKQFLPEVISQLLENDVEVTNLMVSCVSMSREDFLCVYGKLVSKIAQAFYWFDSSLKTPFSIDYRERLQLGADRLGLVAACHALYPNQNCMVVDLGTCITYDFFVPSKGHIGGYITAGMQMRFNAMHDQTELLPQIEAADTMEKRAYGLATKECMLQGVEYGILHELKGFYAQHSKSYHDTKLVITGGDCQLFSEVLKIEHECLPQLVLTGINHILEYNLNQG